MSVEESADYPPKLKQVDCADHGRAYQTFVCEHPFANPAQEWFSKIPDESSLWPDAWCKECDKAFQQEGEWNEKNERQLKVKLLCNHCYERHRKQGTFGET